MIQPDIVADLAGSNQFRASGLMARFFYAVPVTTVGRRDVRKRHIIPMQTREAYQSAVLSLLADYPPEPGSDTKPKALFLDDAAEEIWLDFAQEIEDQLGEGGAFDSIRDWASKLAGTAARVAALLELAATGLTAATISLESMHQAIKLARLLIPHTGGIRHAGCRRGGRRCDCCVEVDQVQRS
jgi:replicative DNA helicase